MILANQQQTFTIHTLDNTIVLDQYESEFLHWLADFKPLAAHIVVQHPTVDVQRFLDSVLHYHGGLETAEIRQMMAERDSFFFVFRPRHQTDQLVSKIQKELRDLVRYYSQIACALGIDRKEHKFMFQKCFAHPDSYDIAFDKVEEPNQQIHGLFLD